MKQAAPIYRHPRWAQVRKHVLERDNYTCQVKLEGCTHTANTVDHIISHLIGGAWYDPTNLRASCEPCNKARKRYRKTKPTITPQAPTPSRQW